MERTATSSLRSSEATSDLIFTGLRFEAPKGRGPGRGEHFTVRFREPDGKKRSMFVGRFNVFLPEQDGKYGLKLLKNLYSGIPAPDQVGTIVAIHRLLAKAGLGPDTKRSIVEVSFKDCPGFEYIRPLLHWDCDKEFDTFRGFWTETLEAKGILANRIMKPFNLWLRSLPKHGWFAPVRRLGCTAIVRNKSVLGLYGRLLNKPLEQKLVRLVCEHALRHRKGSTTVSELMDNALFDGESWKVYDIDKNFHLGFESKATQSMAADAPKWSLNGHLPPEKCSVLGLGLASCGPLLTLNDCAVTMVHATWPGTERLLLEREKAGAQNVCVLQLHYDDPWFQRMVRGIAGTRHFDRLLIGDVWRDTTCRMRLAEDLLRLTAPGGVILFQEESELKHWEPLLKKAAGTSPLPELLRLT